MNGKDTIGVVLFWEIEQDVVEGCRPNSLHTFLKNSEELRDSKEHG